MGKDLVFIASGGRTGTQFFGDVLRTVIDDCWSEHEPDMVAGFSRLTLARIRTFGAYNMVIGRLTGQAGVRVLGHRLLTGSISQDECVRRLRRSRMRYHAGITQSLVVESYFRWWMLAGLIHRIWPGAKTVGVIRDPREWVESWLRHHPGRHAGNQRHWFPLGPLTPRLIGDTDWADRWDALEPFGKLAWDWRTVYGQLDRASVEAPNVRIFRFEDLFDPDGQALRELVRFTAEHGERRYRVHDLEGLTATVRNASSGPRRGWREWPAGDVRLVDDLCGTLMRKYGYGLEPEWQAKLATQSDVTSG